MKNKLLPTIESPKDLKELSLEQLEELAQEIREAICDQVSKTGGHLAPNLGVVELTIALHYVFDFSFDRLLFDVGHQCYAHKLLTGRQYLLKKLRTRQGMSGFPEPRESDFDLFSVGHAGTSISTAVGLARGDSVLDQEDRRVVSLIGDASIVNGVALEGLNNAGTLNRQFLVVLNDNGMSIAKPQGALARYFDMVRVSNTYSEFKRSARKVLNHLPLGKTMQSLYERAGELFRAAIHPDHLFSGFGLVCVGPIDGHDLTELIRVFEQAKEFNRPLLIHCKTIKGKGFDFATGDPTAFHSPKPFVVEGCRVEVKKGGRSFTAAYADAMSAMMKKDDKIFAVTAAMPDGTGIKKVLDEFPERTLDTGICESHAMDMCAGMAKAGLKPFFAVYSTFAQRALDQVFQEVALQGLAVRVCMDRAGFVGGDGAVHHGFMDISMFKGFPESVLLAASDEANLVAALEFMRNYEQGASFLRYPRDNVASKPLIKNVPDFELGKALLVKPAIGPKPDLAILAYGTEVYEAFHAIEKLTEQGFDISLYDARFAKPVDIDLVEHLVAQNIPILTVEDHSLSGGFGACVLEAANAKNVETSKIFRLGMPERWIYQDSRANQLAEVGLDSDGIAAFVEKLVGKNLIRHPKAPARASQRVSFS